MPKVSVALLAASVLALQAHAQTYTASVVTDLTAAPALATYTVTQDTGPEIPLFQKVFDYPYLPYKADSGDGPRGLMQGYNICNETTAGPESHCVTAFLNTPDDFCLWGAPAVEGEELQVVGDIEGEMVAYCTADTHGARVIPAGAITGLQYIKTPDYVEVVGMIDQTALHIVGDDYGGEEDPHGADRRGNPLGSLFYTSAFGPGPSSAYKQVHEWHYFIGNGIFCLKACDPASERGPELCEHIYDRIGCAYNAPANYTAINGTFSSCEGENQMPPGRYVGENGRTSTYTQPDEHLGPITTIPYTAAIPATSQCTTYESASLLSNLVSASTSAASSEATSSAASSGSVAPSGSAVAGESRNNANNAAARPSASVDPSSGALPVAAFSSLVLASGLAFVALFV